MKNTIKIHNDYAIIFLDRNNGISLPCLINIEDLVRLDKFNPNRKWHSRFSKSADTYYAQAGYKTLKESGHIQMHRFIMREYGDFLEKVVHHKNHNGLDNRKSNLEVITKQQNHRNIRRLNPRSSTGYRGVTYDKNKGLFIAQIQLNKKCIFIGSSKDVLEAASMASNYRDKLGIEEFI